MALLFASVIFFVYLCTRKLTLGCMRTFYGGIAYIFNGVY